MKKRRATIMHTHTHLHTHSHQNGTRDEVREYSGRTINKKSTKILSCKPEDREEEVEDRREPRKKKRERQRQRAKKGKTNRRSSYSNENVISKVFFFVCSRKE